MKESEIKERKYIRSEIPLDKDALSKALIIGKGEGRTMEKYAEACGSSSATFLQK